MTGLKNGVWPTMITPYNQDGSVDFGALRAIVRWYKQQGVQGIFSVCQSSEMFYLSQKERVEIASEVVKAAGDDLEVIASGHISDRFEDQVDELKRIADTGVKSVVMVSNRLANQDEDDDVFIANGEKLIEKLPNVSLGVYECPYPYKRLLSEKVLRWMANSGRFTFIKDTCCDAALIAERIRILNECGGNIKLYNANSATVLETLKSGAAGFSGVMANFHSDLYVWLCKNWHSQPEKAEKVQALLTAMSLYETANYPLNAKYHMNLVGVPMELITRNRGANPLNELQKDMVRQIIYIEEIAREICFG